MQDKSKFLKPVNIMFFSSFGDILRGGQKSLSYLVSNLAKESFVAYVIVPNTKGGLAGKLAEMGINVHSMDLPQIKNLKVWQIAKSIWRIKKLIKRHAIDIIHTDGPRNTFYAGIAAKLKKVPLIWHVRASNKDRFDRLLYKLSTKIILVADALGTRFDWAADSNKSVTIYNGVDFSEFGQKSVSEQIRQKYQINSKELLITVTARIEPLKGQKYLIEACGKLKDELGDFKILLAGEISDNSYMNICNKLAIEFNIHDRVIFTGPLDNIPQILNETDIFVLPSLFEAFPRSIIEAMAAGIPVIATDVGGNSEAVENNVSGLIVAPGNAAILADKICFLKRNPNLRKKMGAEARSRALQSFGIRENVSKVEDVYREILYKN